MVKRLILVLTLSLTALVTSGRTQGVSGIWPDPAWCPTCYVASHSDSPAAGSTITGSEVIWTWAGLCFDGSAPTHVAATAVVNGQPWSVDVAWMLGGPRADVTAHLQANGCNGGNVVVPIWFPHGLPSGTERVSVRLHSSGIFAYHVFEVSGESRTKPTR